MKFDFLQEMFYMGKYFNCHALATLNLPFMPPILVGWIYVLIVLHLKRTRIKNCLKKLKSYYLFVESVSKERKISPKEIPKSEMLTFIFVFSKVLNERLWHPEPQQFFCCFIDSLFEVLSDICFISINKFSILSFV